MRVTLPAIALITALSPFAKEAEEARPAYLIAQINITDLTPISKPTARLSSRS